VPGSLIRRLKRRSALIKGAPESEIVREALEAYLSPTENEQSAYEVAEKMGLLGLVSKGPKDLSTSRRHFKGFGKNR
jgi:hypothetical protein